MRRRLKAYVICSCAAMVLGAFPAQAGRGTMNPPAAESTLPGEGEQPGTEEPEAEAPDGWESVEGEAEPSGGAGQGKESSQAAGEDTDNGEEAPAVTDGNASGQDDGGSARKGLGGLDGGTLPAGVKDTTEEIEGQEEPAGWLTKGNVIKLAVAVAAGLAVIGGGVYLWFCSRKKEEQRREEARRQEEEKRRIEEQRARGQEAREREAARKREAEAAAARQTRETASTEETEILETSLPSAALPDVSRGTIGKVHHIGRRRNQQDTMGTAPTRLGLLAVVSDGMGGLSDGEKVSQKAVQGMLQASGRVAVPGEENPLFVMLSEANEQVLQMLGPDQIYKSGATLLAVLVNNSRFHWVAVGDSRIYLYCGGHLLQINREHIYKQQLLEEAVNKNISFSRAATDPQRDRLVSFLGMGELKWVDGSLRPVDVKQGDKLLLMSDGIFNTISEGEIIRILESTRNAADAAALMEKQVLAAGNPKQDNFTCVILDF